MHAPQVCVSGLRRAAVPTPDAAQPRTPWGCMRAWPTALPKQGLLIPKPGPQHRRSSGDKRHEARMRGPHNRSLTTSKARQKARPPKAAVAWPYRGRLANGPARCAGEVAGRPAPGVALCHMIYTSPPHRRRSHKARRALRARHLPARGGAPAQPRGRCTSTRRTGTAPRSSPCTRRRRTRRMGCRMSWSPCTSEGNPRLRSGCDARAACSAGRAPAAHTERAARQPPPPLRLPSPPLRPHRRDRRRAPPHPSKLWVCRVPEPGNQIKRTASKTLRRSRGGR